MRILFSIAALAGTLGAYPAAAWAEPMTFTLEGGGCSDSGNCSGWISASGDIAVSTPMDFLAFLQRQRNTPKVLRFNSNGGSLQGGLNLGKLIREKGFDTEAVLCASSCTYAFLGGVARRYVSETTRFGVHRFFRNPQDEKAAPVDGIDQAQQVSAQLLKYITEMGVDAQFLSVASEAGSRQVRWISRPEAVRLKVEYQPLYWKDWEIRNVGEAVTAVSTRIDGSVWMMAGCTGSEGAYLALVDTRPAALQWMNQCKAAASHSVLGVEVPSSRVRFSQWAPSGAAITFKFPKGAAVQLRDPSLFTDAGRYSAACLSRDYGGTTGNFQNALAVAMKNCASQ